MDRKGGRGRENLKMNDCMSKVLWNIFQNDQQTRKVVIATLMEKSGVRQERMESVLACAY